MLLQMEILLNLKMLQYVWKLYIFFYFLNLNFLDITRFPCNECAKLIIQSGIKTVIYLKDKDCIETRASKRLFDATKVCYRFFFEFFG